jgi:hypothetical protein
VPSNVAFFAAGRFGSKTPRLQQRPGEKVFEAAPHAESAASPFVESYIWLLNEEGGEAVSRMAELCKY